MKTKKIFSMSVVFLLVAILLTGCAPKFTEEEVAQLLAEQKTAYNTQLNTVVKTAEATIEKLQNDLAERPTQEEIGELSVVVEELTQELENKNADLTNLELEMQMLKEEIEELTPKEQEPRMVEELDLAAGEGFGIETYDDGDIEYLFDDKISFDGDNYDAHETIYTTNDIAVMYSLLYDKEFGNELYVGTKDAAAFGYRIVFDDMLLVADIDRNEPLKLPFLGETLYITKMDATEFEVRTGKNMWLNTGDVYTIGDVEIVFNAVSLDGDSAMFTVKDSVEWIDENDEKSFDGVSIAVEKVRTIRDGEGSAQLVIVNSDDPYQVFENGDSIVYDQSTTNADWIFKFSVVGGELEFFGIEHNKKMDELDDDVPPFGVGKTLNFPNDYAMISFDSVNVEKYAEMVVEFDDFETESGSFDGDGIIFTIDIDDGFEIDGEETDKVYAYTTDNGATWSLAYMDEDNEIVDAVSTTFNVVFMDTEYDVLYDGTHVNIDMLKFVATVDGGKFSYIGTDKEDSESDELLYNGIEIGTREYDVLGNDGMVIKEPKHNGDDDVVELLVPEDVLEATIVIGK